MKVCVASPYELEALNGNSVTTRRIVALLNSQGMEARGTHRYDGEAADVLISLHAVKGAPAVSAFLEKNPQGKVIVLITGTDLYESLPAGSTIGLSSLELVDRIVVVQEAAVLRLPERFRAKTVVIPASLDEFEVPKVQKRPPWVISVVGHLRPVKRPFLTIEALAKHPEWKKVRVWQIGRALDEESALKAREWERQDARYSWLGGLSREDALARCAQSSLTVNSSTSEGGANAVLEAMTLGVPVLASRIEGNMGQLGEDYPGYFSDEELATRLQEIFAGEVDLSHWVECARARLPKFSREEEAKNWLRLIKELA